MENSGMEPSRLQATLVDFALTELVRQHRESFEPLWTQESWAKLLIWLALNCGCSGDEAGMRAFAEALGPRLSQRLRSVYFRRDLEDLDLQVMADPSEAQVLVIPCTGSAEPLPLDRIARALDRLGLAERVQQNQLGWRQLEAAIAIPWETGKA